MEIVLHLFLRLHTEWLCDLENSLSLDMLYLITRGATGVVIIKCDYGSKLRHWKISLYLKNQFYLSPHVCRSLELNANCLLNPFLLSTVIYFCKMLSTATKVWKSCTTSLNLNSIKFKMYTPCSFNTSPKCIKGKIGQFFTQNFIVENVMWPILCMIALCYLLCSHAKISPHHPQNASIYKATRFCFHN